MELLITAYPQALRAVELKPGVEHRQRCRTGQGAVLQLNALTEISVRATPNIQATAHIWQHGTEPELRACSII